MKLPAPFNTATGQTDPTLTWQNGNLATGTKGSIVAFQDFLTSAEEIVNTIQAAGITPSDADMTQLYQAIMHFIQVAINGIPAYGVQQNGGLSLSNGQFGVNMNNLIGENNVNSADRIMFFAEEAENNLTPGMPYAINFGALCTLVLGALASGEGISTAGNAVALNVPALPEYDALTDGDLVPYFNAAQGHHRKTNFGSVYTYLKQYFPIIPASGASVTATIALTPPQNITSNVFEVVNLGNLAFGFGICQSSIVTVYKAGIYSLTGLITSNSFQRSGEIQYSSLIIKQNGIEVSHEVTFQYSYGEVGSDMNLTVTLYAQANDQFQMIYYTHSASNDDTNDVITGATLTVLKLI